MRPLVCLATCPDADTARRIAGALVEARLAACVNLLPGVHSIYRWEGQVCSGDEVMLVIKTSQARLEALTDRFRELHPFEVPELVALPVEGGLAAYLHWIGASTLQDTEPGDAPAEP